MLTESSIQCQAPLDNPEAGDTYILGICSQKKRYHAVGFPYNRMLKLSSSGGIRIDVPVLSVSWSFVDHSVRIQALRKGLIEHEASDTGGVPRWKSSCSDRLAEATISSSPRRPHANFDRHRFMCYRHGGPRCCTCHSRPILERNLQRSASKTRRHARQQSNTDRR